MKKTRLTAWILIALPIAAIALELLPYGVALNFGYPSETGEIGWFRETYSYFSLMPYGYGVFGPLIAAALTCVTAVTASVSVILKKNWTKTIAVLCTVAAALSASPLLLGYRYVTVLGAVITLLLAGEAVFAFRLRNG